MTINEAIKTGNLKELKRIDKQMEQIRKMDLDQKMFVIKVYLICKAIAIIGFVLIAIEHFKV